MLDPLHTLIWKRIDHVGAEYFQFARVQDTIRLEGHVVIALDKAPLYAHYVITCDAKWRTREVTINEMIGSEEKHVHLTVEGLRWFSAGAEAPDLYGCTDVDLEISPATNTLPMGRLQLSVGSTDRITAAWVRFPSLNIQRSAQQYTRLAERRYRYQSGTYQTELSVDDRDLITEYPGGWVCVSAASPAR